MINSLPSLFQYSKKYDALAMMFLIVFSFFVMTSFLYGHGRIMVHYDSYVNFENAMSLAVNQTPTSKSEVVLPATQVFFTYFLASLYNLFPDHVSALLSLRLITLTFAIQSVVVFYFIARKVFNITLSLVVSILALFIPVFLAFSGTLESNIFATAMGLTSFYFSIKPQRLYQVIIATIFIILCLSRLDSFVVFAIPYLIGLSHYLSLKTHVKFYIIATSIILGLFVPFYFVIQNAGGIYSVTAFHRNILEQIISLVRFDTIQTILKAALEITGDKAEHIRGDDGLNKLYAGIILFGLIYFIFTYRKTIYRIFRFRDYKFGDGSITIVYLIIVMFVSLISLAAFHMQFRIVGGELLIDNKILPRYMIEMRLFFIPLFVYGLFVLTSSSHRLISKRMKSNTDHDSTLQNNSESVDYVSSFQLDEKLISLIFVAIIISVFVYSMWDTAVMFYENYATQIQVYYTASKWLKDNLDEDDKVFLPMKQVFWSIEPSLKQKTFVYKSIWSKLGYYTKPDATDEEIQTAQTSLKEFIHDKKNNVKFIVVDWVDTYGKWGTGLVASDLPQKGACQKFDPSLKEVKKFTFVLPNSNWGSAMIVCQTS